MRRSLTLLLLTILPACQSTTQQEAAEIARLERYHGMTMAQFSATTGLTPTDFYNGGGGRVFVVQTAPVYITTPAYAGAPAITTAHACRLLIQTAITGRGNSADYFTITGLSKSGACPNL